MISEEMILKPSDFRQIRKFAVQCIYQQEINQQFMIQNSIFQQFVVQAEVPEIYRKCLRTWVEAILSHTKKIDSLIEKNAKNWKLFRIVKVDMAILRVATFELLERLDTDMEVILFEAVALAREFSSHNSASFVNGILDAIAKSVRSEV